MRNANPIERLPEERLSEDLYKEIAQNVWDENMKSIEDICKKYGYDNVKINMKRIANVDKVDIYIRIGKDYPN
jgi:hypothetical protein